MLNGPDDRIWKPIKDYDDLYEISNYGEIISKPRKGTKGGLLKPFYSNGYLIVKLMRNAIPFDVSVHKLVWEHFGDEPQNNLTIDHIDENKENNYIGNLQLLTNRANCAKGKAKYRDLPTGVIKHPQRNGYVAQGYLNGNRVYLGYFGCPTMAHFAYLKSIQAGRRVSPF